VTAPLGQRLGGGELRPVVALAAFHLDEFGDLLAVVAYEIASHRLANPVSPCLVVDTRR
jgi:hypothetical protein